MTSKDLAIKVENICKVYRIGLKQGMNDSFGSAIFGFIKSPLKNYFKYRSLYNFDDISFDSYSDSNSNASDIIWALKGVSFDVKQGEVVGIIGRNGAGKSTLLKVLCKITDPTRGCVEIRGRVSSLLEVGTGFHQELTGRENVYLNGTILGMKKNEVESRFDEIVEFSGIERFIDTPVKRYSSGMKVRLAFSVAAHLEPEVLIIDEVLAVGDAEFQKKCLNKMQDVGRRGRTVLFVSHNMQAVNRLCERTILIEGGRVIGDGPTAEITSAYLKTDYGTMTVRKWPDPATAPTGPIARLRAVRVKTEDRKMSEVFDIRLPIGLELEYDVLKSGSVLLPHFRLTNDQGQCAFITLDQDPEWRGVPRPTGNYVSTAWIPGNFLSEGMLIVDCFITTVNPTIHQCHQTNAVAFNVIDSLDGDSARGDYAGKIQGAVRPILKWDTHYRPE